MTLTFYGHVMSSQARDHLIPNCLGTSMAGVKTPIHVIVVVKTTNVPYTLILLGYLKDAFKCPEMVQGTV